MNYLFMFNESVYFLMIYSKKYVYIVSKWVEVKAPAEGKRMEALSAGIGSTNQMGNGRNVGEAEREHSHERISSFLRLRTPLFLR